MEKIVTSKKVMKNMAYSLFYELSVANVENRNKNRYTILKTKPLGRKGFRERVANVVNVDKIIISPYRVTSQMYNLQHENFHFTFFV